MNELRYITNYQDQDRLRTSFNELAGEVFGIDFEAWYRLGLWSDRYIAFSFAEGDRVVANASASLLTLILDDRPVQAVQIGTVMTHPDYRGRGLSTRLMETILDTYKDRELLFLKANGGALEFYPRFGFRAAAESGFSAQTDILPAAGSKLKKLDPRTREDMALILGLTASRAPVSSRFGVLHAERITAWHCLYLHPDAVYYDPEEDVLLLFRQEGGTVHLYDVIAARRPAALIPLLAKAACERVRRIIFSFTPEFADIQAQADPAGSADTLFIKPLTAGLPAFPEGLAYPETAQA